ncbi:MAG TPA: hypothetical protein VFP98_02765, partial [Candidatus Polarisedimenticolia bacterium]|nr:hypothetical protein [Candidatus Polarisedimenticolia bacterium]
EHMTEADVFVKYGLADRAIEQLQAVTEKYPGYAPAHARLKEIYVEEGNREAARDQRGWLVRCHLAAGDRGAAEECLAELRRYDPACRQLALLDQAVNPGGLRAGMAIGSGADLEIEAGLDDALFETESAPRGGAGPQAREAGQDAAPSIEGLEEVDFYIDRRLRDEAVAVLRRLAEAHGSHPEIVSRMRKAMQLSVEPESIAPSPQPDGAEEFEISLDYSDQSSAIPASTASGPAGAGADDGSIDLMDLASEVDAALSGHTADESTVISGDEAEPEGHSLEEIVQAFRKGIEKQVGAEDFDTHYSLGIAYKEMGLLDEAIGEFQFAAKDARLLVDCCSMLGVCFRDKGMPPLAVKWYRKGIDAANGREEEVVLGLRYDLADLLAAMGEHRHAIELFTEIFGINSNYRDVAARIKELERTKSG